MDNIDIDEYDRGYLDALEDIRDLLGNRAEEIFNMKKEINDNG